MIRPALHDDVLNGVYESIESFGVSCQNVWKLFAFLVQR
jgi:hypothetical protein